MTLKAYKHLTDGEVKIVEGGSAEETSLLADTVTGSSYLQLTSTRHSEEVAAAQGTALWVDVTSDLGSGGGGGLPTGMDYQLFEVTNLAIPSGTDWSVEGHSLGQIPFDFFFASFDAFPEAVLYKFALHTAAAMNGTDKLHLGLVRDIHDAANTVFDDASVTSARNYQTEAHMPGFATYSSSFPTAGTSDIALFTEAPTTADILILYARASFLIF